MAAKIQHLSHKVGRFKTNWYLVIYLDNGNVKYIILQSVVVNYEQNILSYLSRGGGGGKAKFKVNFKIKYDFSTNIGRNKYNTFFSCNFDWEFNVLYYFHPSRSPS